MKHFEIEIRSKRVSKRPVKLIKWKEGENGSNRAENEQILPFRRLWETEKGLTWREFGLGSFQRVMSPLQGQK